MMFNLILTVKKCILLFVSIGLMIFMGLSYFTYPQISPGCPIPKSTKNNNFYSQYLEDYILSILFKGVKKGHYIDVGANDPDHDSVTKYFYLKGWRGINIEPIHKQYLKLMTYRPEDQNFNIGIAEQSKNLLLSVIYRNDKDIDNDGLSTFDPAVLKQAIQDGLSYKSVTVSVKPLNEILQAHPLQPIHFIKIDVEGMEDEVLKSIDLTKYRPWAFIIEATEPRTFIRSDEKWKNTLLQNNYIEVMFDGLNAYYIAKEHQDALHQQLTKAYDCASEVNEKFHIINNKITH